MNSQVDQIAGVLGGLSVLLLIAGYALHLERRRLEARLHVFVGGRMVHRGEPSEARAVPSPRQWSVWRRIRLGAAPGELTQAGVSLTPRRFLFLQVAAGLLGLGLALLVAGRMRLAGMEVALVLVACAGVGFAVPKLVLRIKRGRRFGRFERQLASALDALASGMEVGLSLSQALEMVSRDMPAPLGPEFGQVIRGLGMGLPLSEALDQLAERMPLRDVEIFVAAVHIQYRTGGALSGVLRTIASTVRERVNLRGEIHAMTSQQRLSAYLVSGLPLLIALLMKFLSPAYFDRLLIPGSMRLMVFGAGLGIVVGFYIMMRIADIEV